MKKALDSFSKQSEAYKKYRPIYPADMYEEILKFVKGKDECWDCATGNGQVAIRLSKYFEKVQATDISKNQITQAETKSNIKYSIQRAEKTAFKDDQFDLITVGQAAHWFDLEAFSEEVKRVAKNKGILSIWGYGLLQIEQPVNTLINEFYYDITGPYWDEERKHLDHEYETIRFDFEELEYSKNRSIKLHWTLSDLAGYLNSWSAVQHYMNANEGINPVNSIIERISAHWEENVKKEVQFPMYLKIWRIQK